MRHTIHGHRQKLRRSIERRAQLLALLRFDPAVESCIRSLARRCEIVLQRIDLRIQLQPARPVLHFGNNHKGRRIWNVSVQRGLRRIAEKRGHGVKIFLQNGIEFVIVTGGAADRHPQEDCTCGVHTILGVHRLHFLFNHAAFVGGDLASMKPGCNLLLQRLVRQQIASHLFDGESIEWHVSIERADYPIAIGPHFAIVIDVQSMGVGVACGIQPVTGAMLSILRRGQQAIH